MTQLIKYSYKCKKCGEFETYSLSEYRGYPKFCPKCNELSDYIVSAPRIKLEGWSGDFPSSASKWERHHEREGKKGPS